MAGMKTKVLAALAAAIAAVGPDAASAAMVDAMQVASITPDILTDSSREIPGTPIVARVDLSDQRMYVYLDERLVYTFPVSSGRGERLLAVAEAPVAEIQQRANALGRVLQRRLCRAWDHRPPQSRAAGVARLHPPASG
jgi:hypothetical protein